MPAFAAYHNYSAILSWGHVVSKKNKKRTCKKMVLGPGYFRRDDCMMAAVFGYIRPLLEKILATSLPCERENVLSLFSGDVCITISKGNLFIQAV